MHHKICFGELCASYWLVNWVRFFLFWHKHYTGCPVHFLEHPVYLYATQKYVTKVLSILTESVRFARKSSSIPSGCEFLFNLLPPATLLGRIFRKQYQVAKPLVSIQKKNILSFQQAPQMFDSRKNVSEPSSRATLINS